MSRILIIDDEELVRYALRAVLESADHDVIEAENGMKGIELCNAHPVDLVITDIIMPEKEGVETIIELRRAFPDVKIIAISGGGRSGGVSYLKLAQGFGADQIMPKPFGMDEMLSTVQRVLNGTEKIAAASRR